ncbi:MAG: PQQ-binding-like beta-propeller repeat protein [Candidatus Eiseniibacteriota bacterium]
MFSTPAVVGDVVCVGSCSGVFYALDRATGQPRDRHDVFSEDSVHRQFHGDALLDGDLLLIGTDAGEGDSAYVFAFERGSAKVRWRRSMGPGLTCDIARWRSYRYIVTLLDELVCFDAASGATRWSYRAHPSLRNDRSGSPAVVGDRVVFADRDGVVHAFDAATGRALWRRPQIDPLSTWLAVADSSLIFVRGQDALVRLDPVTGMERGRSIIPGGPFVGPITNVGDSLLLLLGPRTLTCFDLTRDRVRWSRSDAREWSSSRPYVWRDMALAGSERGRVVAYGLADGAERWTHPLVGVPRGIGMGADTLYVGTLKGRLHAFVERREATNGR